MNDITTNHHNSSSKNETSSNSDIIDKYVKYFSNLHSSTENDTEVTQKAILLLTIMEMMHATNEYR